MIWYNTVALSISGKGNNKMRIMCGIVLAATLSAFADVRTVEMEPGENWWGAANFFGTKRGSSVQARP